MLRGVAFHSIGNGFGAGFVRLGAEGSGERGEGRGEDEKGESVYKGADFAPFGGDWEASNTLLLSLLLLILLLGSSGSTK